MEDRRKLPRRHLYYYSRVFNEDTHEMAGRLVDISREGMMIISDKPIQSNTRYKFKLILPVAVEGRKHLVIEAQSKWSKHAAIENQYDNGFSLVNINPQSARMIEKIVKRTEVV